MSRRARLQTESTHAEVVAAALAPDNTPEMETAMDGDAIETTIARESTGGLRTTVDDYVINLSVAECVARTAERHATEHGTDRAADRTAEHRTTDQPRSTDDVDDTQNTNDTNP